jgi:hypothetical protein
VKNARTRINIIIALGIILAIAHVVSIVVGAFYVGSLPLSLVWIAAWTILDAAIIFHPWRKKVA